MRNRPGPITTSLGFGLHVKDKVAGPRNSEEHPKSRQARILVVDSDPEMRRLISARLITADYSVETADHAEAALDACVRSRPNLVITDLRLGPMDGLSLLKELKHRWPQVTVIILTAHGTIPAAVDAIQHGAFGFLVKPVEKLELLGQVQRALVNSTFTPDSDWRASIISRSKLMEDRLAQAKLAAASDAPVVLTGEDGTGKELFARAIHAASGRRSMPFIAFHCRAIPGRNLQLELFGPGGTADRQPPSAIQAARGGTLMLHEIGDLPLQLQVKLLDALAGQGDADLRLISTTAFDLKRLMEAGKLRQDLYYQINILRIEIPPLGRRREDIPLLVANFLEQAPDGSGPGKIYSRKAIELLSTTDWPGNVRQLFELVKQNVALAPDEVMTESFVQESLGGQGARGPTFDEAREKFSREYLANNLLESQGNISKAARLAKRNRTDFYKLLTRYRLQADDFKKPK